MNHSKLCLIQLLHLLQKNHCKDVNDLVVYHLYNIRNRVSSNELREWFLRFIRAGADPFSKDLNEVSKLMIKSIVSRCDK